jgi:uncharacterized protein YneR
MLTCSSLLLKSSQALNQPESGEGVQMSDEDLEVLITLDDPWYGPDEDLFHQHQEDYNEMLLTSI